MLQHSTEDALMFVDHDIDTMNEADVRDIICRPFLHALGFRQGSEANIRTEVPLAYDAAFLGRKKPDKDPPLRGRADYICDLVSFGRWVLEAKPPSEPLTSEDAEQAHTYAAHPSVAALFYVLTNGREFRLYRTSHPEEPVFAWPVSSTTENLVLLKNYLSPDALKRQFALRPLDTNKPLGLSVGSRGEIVGGIVRYGNHSVSIPAFQQMLDQRGASNAAVTGGHVMRTPEGLIEAKLDVSFGFESQNIMNQLAGITDHTFRTADEYISSDPEHPTIFQAFYKGRMGRGTTLPVGIDNPHLNNQILVDIDHEAFSEAFGYINGRKFEGVFRIHSLYHLPESLPPMARMLGLTSDIEVSVSGSFAINFMDAVET